MVLICAGGAGNGRAVALALAAKGAKVVVTGAPERELGETVGYVVFGGGAARHYPGEDAAGAIEKCKSAFGGLALVVGTKAEVARFEGYEAVVIPEGVSEEEAVTLSDPSRAP